MLLEVHGVEKGYRRGGLFGRGEPIPVLCGVDLALDEGASLGLIGRSGSGKSTLGRIVLGLERPDAGEVLFQGQNLHDLPEADRRRVRRDLQVVFQDTHGALNPRRTVGASVAEPLQNYERLAPRQLQERVGDLLALVGLAAADATKYPHQFSGGQLQRIAIARASALSPRLIVLDEAVSSLDMLVQARILDLLVDLQQRFGTAYLFIAHDLRVVARLTRRLAVMDVGRIATVVDLDRPPQLPIALALRCLMEAVPGPPPRTSHSVVAERSAAAYLTRGLGDV
jgi:nickel transport system ATP-binding protein